MTGYLITPNKSSVGIKMFLQQGKSCGAQLGEA